MREPSATPFPYFLTEEEIVQEIISFAKMHEKWPITSIGYISRFHIFHNSNPHDMTTYSHQQSVLASRKKSLDRELYVYDDRSFIVVEGREKINDNWGKPMLDKDGKKIPKFTGDLRSKYSRNDSSLEYIESLEREISHWNSKVIVSNEQLGHYKSIYARTRIMAQEKLDSLFLEIIESQKKEIIHHSRELSNASSAIGKKGVSMAQVRDYVNKLSTPLIVPDSRNVLYARANFVLKGLRE